MDALSSERFQKTGLGMTPVEYTSTISMLRTLQLTKVWYFCFFAHVVLLYPFQNLFFKQVGFDEAQIGIISGLRPWISAISSFIVPYFADITGQHNKIQLICILLAISFRMFLQVYQKYTQQLFLVLFSDFFHHPIGILQDTKVVSLCHYIKNNNKIDPKYIEGAEYGKIRLWGAVSWGTMSVVAGYILNKFGFKQIFIFYAISGLVVVFLTGWISYSIPIKYSEQKQLAQTPSEEEIQFVEKQYGNNTKNNNNKKNFDLQNNLKVKNIQIGKNYLKKAQNNSTKAILFSIISKRKDFSFFIMAYFFGSAVGLIDSYLYLYLQYLGGSQILMGLTLTFMVTTEIPVFQYFSIIEKKLGLDLIFDIVFIAFIIRLLCYASLNYLKVNFGMSLWIILPIETLHGITFGFAWAGGTQKSRELASPGLEATFQGIFGCIFSGVGNGMGGIIGGQLYYKFSPEFMFLSAVIWMCFGWVISRGQFYLYDVLKTQKCLEKKYTNIIEEISKNNQNV